MTWGFLWLMLALKLPLAALIYIVWWAIKAEPEPPETGDDDGGTKRQPPHPRQPFPRTPRRGPARRSRAAPAGPRADDVGRARGHSVTERRRGPDAAGDRPRWQTCR